MIKKSVTDAINWDSSQYPKYPISKSIIAHGMGSFTSSGGLIPVKERKDAYNKLIERIKP